MSQANAKKTYVYQCLWCKRTVLTDAYHGEAYSGSGPLCECDYYRDEGYATKVFIETRNA